MLELQLRVGLIAPRRYDDVVATIAKLQASGGKRVGDPMAMPGMATFGYFKDPSGTTMGQIGP